MHSIYFYLQSENTGATRIDKHKQGVASYKFWAFIINASCRYFLLPFKISHPNLFQKLLVLFQTLFLNNHQGIVKKFIAFLFFIKKIVSRGNLFHIHIGYLVLPITFKLNPVDWLVSVIKTSPSKKYIYIYKKKERK